MREVVLREPLATLWRQYDAFDEAQRLVGEVVREKEGRQTIRCEIAGEVFYRKFHSGVGWREILKNWLSLRAAVVDASNEWLAIEKVKALGVSTLEAVAYGRKGRNPATRKSFLITRELKGALSTAEFTSGWPEAPPSFALRLAMIARMAWIARQIHEHGINHRDLYLCHFLLDISSGIENLSAKNLDFYLVDLHRAQIREQVPRRWRVKDVASIYFSALDIGLTRRDVLRFLRAYYQRPLRTVLRTEARFLRQVERRARKLYIRDFKREPEFPI